MTDTQESLAHLTKTSEKGDSSYFFGVPHLFPKDAGVSRSTLPSLGGKSHDYVLIAAVPPGPPPTLAGCWLEVLHPESLSVLIPWTVFIPPDPKVPTPGNVQEKDDPFY